MKLLNKMERKFSRFAIRNLTWYIIVSYGVGYILSMIVPQTLSWIALEPYQILHGQVWRLVSWLLIPPERSNIFFILIMLSFYYYIGTALESAWGAFRYNLYVLGGVLFTIIGAFLLYAVLGGNILLNSPMQSFSTYYVAMALMLGFALTYPNQQVLLYFIIPIKIKWLAILDLVFMALALVQGGWIVKTMVLASLLNIIVFMILTKNYKQVLPNRNPRKKEFTRAVHKSQTNITKHKCAICQRTELDGAQLEFRFCSKCKGNYEYCQDHLFTHEHVK